MEFLLIATAHFLALVSPGADFFLVMQGALRLPVRYAITICAGIACANGVYLVFAVASLEAIRNMAWLTTGLNSIGAAYLIFIGISLLRSQISTTDEARPATFLATENYTRQFAIGFTSGIVNPKNAIFYLSLFTAMVSDSTGLGVRAAYAAWMFCIVFFWDAGLVLLFAQGKVLTRHGSAVIYVERVSGLFLLLFGMLLPFR